MASYVSNLIEYSGICDVLPTDPHAFKQFTVQETVCLPEAKPDIEQITRVMCDVKIKHTKVIKTPIGESAEGQKLTGFKVIVEGEVHQKVEYVADEPTQSVHAAHFSVPFSTFIVLPAPAPGFGSNCYHVGSPVTVTACIEDIYAKQIGKRCIFKNITLLAVAEI